MEKTLKTIQKIIKVLSVLSKIAFVFAIIGAAFSLLGILALGLISDVVIDGIPAMDYIAEMSKETIPTAYASMVVSAITCGGLIALTTIYNKYFKYELESGTPFTLDGAKKLMTVGICAIAIPIGISLINAFAMGIISLVFREAVDVDMDMSVSITTGLVILFISLLCKYGAQVIESKKTVEEKAAEVQQNEENN